MKTFFDSGAETQPVRPPENADSGREVQAGESYFESQKRKLPETLSARNDELERLRLRQEALEKQKQSLAGLRRKLQAFEEGRRDLLEKLERSRVLLAHEEDRAARMATLCAESHRRFDKLKQELAAQAPDSWTEAEFEETLTRALAQIEAARLTYRKTLDRVNASDWQSGAYDNAAPADLQDTRRSPASAGFWFWLKAGVAFSLPLGFLLLLVAGLLAWRLGWWV